jgi:hypothetical protein
MSAEKAPSPFSQGAVTEFDPDQQEPPLEFSTNAPLAPSSDPQYPTGLKLGIIIFGLCLAVFCVALDNTIIATAIC